MRSLVRAQLALIALVVAAFVASPASAAAAQQVSRPAGTHAGRGVIALHPERVTPVKAIRKTRSDMTTLAASTSVTTTRFGVTTPGGFGATAELDQVARAAGAAPSVVMAYSDFTHPLDVAGLDAAAARKATPMVTWEPWAWGGGTDQPAYSLARITAGTYDGYIRGWARGLRSWGKPVYLRFGHEMNGDWYPWSERVNGNRPGDYVAAWRHVWGVFDAQKVTNVRWVWSPNVTYPGSLDLRSLYPGAKYVDDVAVDGYNWGTAATWSTWTTPGQLFDATLAELRALAPGKPIIVAEVASAEQGGSKAGWVTGFFGWLRAQPDVGLFVWFDQAKEADWRIDSSDSSAAAFASGLAGLRARRAAPGRLRAFDLRAPRTCCTLTGGWWPGGPTRDGTNRSDCVVPEGRRDGSTPPETYSLVDKRAVPHRGRVLLILDADQVLAPEILDHTLGYFKDERVALVQTPQWFCNVPDADPLGSQAPLFYGPIQQGKDGWNAAFFCGSNAVLRREALMQLGVVGHVRDVERAVREALGAADRVVSTARREARAYGSAALTALDQVVAALSQARAELRAREPISEVTYRFQERVEAASRSVVSADVEAMRADLPAIAALPMEVDRELGVPVVDEVGLTRLAQRDWTPLGALQSVRALVRAVDVDRSDEAQPVMPMSTVSVTEDMATAMRLRALGWRAVYHHEVLARGLAPDDLQTMLQHGCGGHRARSR